MTAPKITLEDIRRLEGIAHDETDENLRTLYLRLCAAARRGVEADAENADFVDEYLTRFKRPSALEHSRALKKIEEQKAIIEHVSERAEKAEAANVKLVGAIDMIRETLNGGNVQDLLLIINNALDEARNV